MGPVIIRFLDWVSSENEESQFYSSPLDLGQVVILVHLTI